MPSTRHIATAAAAAVFVPLALTAAVGCTGTAHHDHAAPTAARSGTGEPTGSKPTANPHTADPDPRHLALGDCFSADRTLTLIGATVPLGNVHIVPCTRSHNAEVYGRFTYVDGAYPTGKQLTDIADVDCANLTSTYDMDGWTVSPTVDLARSLLPTKAQWAAGDHDGICYWAPRDPPATTGLRHDKTTLTADQYAYLDAANRPVSALAATPGSQGEDDRDSYQFWAGGVADSLTTEAQLLGGHTWPARAQGPVNALLQRVNALIPLWRDASQEATLDGIKHATHTLQARSATSQEISVRRALGLATARAR